MSINRRDFLHLTALIAGSSVLSGCRNPYQPLLGTLAAPPVHLHGTIADFQALNRLTFGPRSEELTFVAEHGLAAWIEEQLGWQQIDDSAADWRVRPFDTLTMDANQLYSLEPEQVINQLCQATLLRKLYSRRQLYEVLVDFWSDHFNISLDKGNCCFLKPIDDRSVIRPHVLGNFSDLLWASTHSPAMLIYLDNQANQKGQPNENYARELLELHTIGIHGGYSQRDVMELARCLTGWTVKEHFYWGDFNFDANTHDDGQKNVLGRMIPANGQHEAESVIAQIAVHPATAHFLATKLAHRFLGDEPPAEIVQKAAAIFTQTNGDLTSTTRLLLLDGVAKLRPLAAKFKRPLHVVASSLRQLNAESDGGPALHDFLRRMGQPLFAWPMPNGYSDRNADWINNLLPRWQFALALTQNQISGTQIDLAALMPTVQIVDAQTPTVMLDRLSHLLLGQSLSPSDQDLLLTVLHAPLADAGADEWCATLAAGMVASPAFQWH